MASRPEVQLSRTIKTQSELYEFYGKPKEPPSSFCEKITNKKCTLGSTCDYLVSLFPIIAVIKTYDLRKYVLDDIISGLSAACLHFPQGLAFGFLASLAPGYGLYTSFFPVLLYVLFGTSQHVSFGTNAVIALFTAELVDLKAEDWMKDRSQIHVVRNSSDVYNVSTIAPDTDHELLSYKASVAAGSACLVGILLLVMGLCRLGFITSYLSSSFIAGFTTAGGSHILTSQIPSALGIPVRTVNKPGKLIYKFIDIFKSLPEVHIPTLILSLICIVILVIVKDVINEKFKDKMKMPIPIDIILVVTATVISHFAKLHDNFKIAIVGEIPTGLPEPKLPLVSVDIIGHSIVVAIIIFVLTISMARLCELKHGYVVNDNQELVAYGIANFGSSFFSCFPSCVAPPRTIILSTMGARTTLNGLVSALLVFLIIMFIGKYMESVPIAVLAAMIMVAIKNLLYQLKDLPMLWRVNRYDFVIFIGTVLSGVLIDFPYALYVGVLLCLLTVVVQSQHSSFYTLGKVDQEDRLLDTRFHDVPDINPKVAIFKMESSLYFATVDKFKKQLYRTTINPKDFQKKTDEIKTEYTITVDTNGSPSEKEDSQVIYTANQSSDVLTHVIVDCSSINYVDMNGIKTLFQINTEFKSIGVTLVLANCTHYMRDFISRSELMKDFDMTNIYTDLLDAYLSVTHKT